MKQFFTLVLALVAAFPAALAADVNVTVKLVYNEGVLTPRRVDLFSTEKFHRQDAKPGLKTMKFTVPEGTYDFHVELCNYDARMPDYAQNDYLHPYYHVFKENVTVTEGTEVTLDVAEATHFVEFSPYLPSGEPVLHPTNRGGVPDLEGATVVGETIGMTFNHDDFGEVQCTYMSGIHRTTAGESYANSMNFYVNDVSDKYKFSQTRMGLTVDEKPYFVGLRTTGAPNGPVTNKDCAYKLTALEFVRSPLADNLPREVYKSGIDIYANINGLQADKLNLELTTDYPEINVSWGSSVSEDDNIEFKIYPRVYDMDRESSSDQRIQLVNDCPILSATPKGVIMQHTTNPYFKWDSEKMYGRLGDNVPLAKGILYRLRENSTTYKWAASGLEYIGRFGEVRNTDIEATMAEVSHDGNVLFTGEYNDLAGWLSSWTEQPTEGLITLKFTNKNMRVNSFSGDASNVAELTYKLGKIDICPPATQMLALTDDNGRMTQVFEKGNKVVIAVAAADVLGTVNTSTGRLTYSTSNLFNWRGNNQVKISYAPHGTNTFTEITVEEGADATSSQAWGIFDATIENPGENGWYDLRISLNDTDGNTSVQTISPAFFVTDDLSSITDVTDSAAAGVSVVCEGSTLVVNGATDGARVEVYAVGGYKVADAQAPVVDLSGLATGIYFARVEGATFKFILK